MFKLPEKVRICGHDFLVEETDDTEKLFGDSAASFNSITGNIYVKKSMSLERRVESFMHEIGEVILRNVIGVKKADFPEKDWSAYSRVFYATIVDNKLSFGEQDASRV